MKPILSLEKKEAHYVLECDTYRKFKGDYIKSG
jgi:hypothetical protein